MKINFVKSIEPLSKKFQNQAVEAGENMRYTLNDARIARETFSRSANSCTIVNLNAGENNFTAHIDPKYFNRTVFLNAFKEKIARFQHKFGEAKAVIFGGWETNRVDPFCKTPSCEVYSTIAAALDEMPLTMICGKKAGGSAYDNLFASKSEVFLGSDTFEKLGLTTTGIKGLSASEIEKQLSKSYEWVEIDPSML